MKRKEWYRDYATHAFITYAALGKPTREQYTGVLKDTLYQKYKLDNPEYAATKIENELRETEPILSDIEAVNQTLDTLEKTGKTEIINAINAVYFFLPRGKPAKGEIEGRVVRYSIDCPASRKTVYLWLKSARLLFCKYRGLHTGRETDW